MVGGDKYLICDPTYESSNPGMCMPYFKNGTPEIIRINKNEHHVRAEQTWV